MLTLILFIELFHQKFWFSSLKVLGVPGGGRYALFCRWLWRLESSLAQHKMPVPGLENGK